MTVPRASAAMTRLRPGTVPWSPAAPAGARDQHARPGDRLRQPAAPTRVNPVQAAGEHGDRHAPGAERTRVRSGVDPVRAAGETTVHIRPLTAEPRVSAAEGGVGRVPVTATA
jgi:hypothetical protein